MVRAFTAQFGNWKYDDWQSKVDNHVVYKAVKNYQQNKCRLRQGRSPQNSYSRYNCRKFVTVCAQLYEALLGRCKAVTKGESHHPTKLIPTCQH